MFHKDYMIIALLWTTWCTLHSFLISTGTQDRIGRLGKLYRAGHRLAYNLFSAVSLLALVAFTQNLDQTVLWQWQGLGRIVQAALIFYSTLLFVLGYRAYDMSFFTGLRQWRARHLLNTTPLQSFSAHGILHHIRHPWYAGGLTFLWSITPMTDISVIVRTILSIYLIIGARLEEAKLLKIFGSRYGDYMKEVPMFFPRLRRE